MLPADVGLSLAQAGRGRRIGNRTTDQRCREKAHNRRSVMTNVQGESQRAGAKTEFDAVIIGAGFSGMYMLHSLRHNLDLTVTVSEAADALSCTCYSTPLPTAL